MLNRNHKTHKSKRGKLLSTSACCATLALGLTTLPGVANAQTFDIQSASATAAHSSFPASNAIDGSTAFASRWAGSGSPERLTSDLGTIRRVDDVRIAWGRGDRQIYSFFIEGRSGTSGNWTQILSERSNLSLIHI